MTMQAPKFKVGDRITGREPYVGYTGVVEVVTDDEDYLIQWTHLTPSWSLMQTVGFIDRFWILNEACIIDKVLNKYL